MIPFTWGGLLIRQNHQILMRDSAGHQGGDVRTFAKTHPAPGEIAVEIARRALPERMGWNSMVLGALGRPGPYSARTSANRVSGQQRGAAPRHHAGRFCVAGGTPMNKKTIKGKPENSDDP
jgi:hypothetical protein